MVVFKVKYVVEKRHRGAVYRYFQPKKRYLIGGEWVDCPFKSVKLPNDAGWYAEAMKYVDALDQWREGLEVSRCRKVHSVGWLIGEFKRDDRFLSLAPATQKLYDHFFKRLEEVIGDIPMAQVSRQQANDIYNSYAHLKRQASQVVQVARVLFNYAKELRWIKENPFEGMRVRKAKPRRVVINSAHIEAAKAKAVELGLQSVAYAIQLGYDAGQRPGDIRTLRRTDYDGKWLRVAQSKTGALVDIPVFKLPELKAMLDGLDHTSTLILHEERTKKPYGKDMLCRRVREVFEAAGIGADIQFRDLRRTAVVRLAEAGCEIPEICAITGHSLKEATQILEVYLPRSRRMAENAIEKVQKLEKR